MSQSFHVRSATAEDSTTLLSMFAQLAEYEGSPEPPRIDEAALLRDVFCDRPKAHIFVAESVEGALLGFVLVFETFSSWAGGAALHVGDLWVEDVARGQDVGRQLVQHALSLFPYVRVDVYVVRSNLARGFYERIGFVEQDAWCLYRKHTEIAAH